MNARALALASLCAFVHLGACAYGAPLPDSDGPLGLSSDAGPHDSGKDASKPVADASAADTSMPDQDVQVDPPDTSVACSLGMPTGLPMCDTCLGQNCCSQDNACATSTDCQSLVTCYDGCLPSDGGPPDGTCLTTCDSTYPTGASILNALTSCLQGSCSTACR